MTISDQQFKKLPHKAQGYEPWHNGQEIMPGYKPDYVLKGDNRYIIYIANVF